jgi:hypothetical protein
LTLWSRVSPAALQSELDFWIAPGKVYSGRADPDTTISNPSADVLRLTVGGVTALDLIEVGGTVTYRFTPQATAPATCTAGADLYTDTSGAWCACTSANTWTNLTPLTGACT